MSIHFENPLKENVCIVGMGQEGKTYLMAYLLHMNPNPYTLFDTLGVFSAHNFQLWKPKVQRILKPAYGQTTPMFLKTCREVWSNGNQIFAVDEMSIHCTKHFLTPDLSTIINQGGNRNIAYWFTTRRVAQIHNDILASCQHHFIFRTYLPQDVDWYATIVPRNVIEMSQTLPKFHFIYYQVGHDPQLYQPVKKVL